MTVDIPNIYCANVYCPNREFEKTSYLAGQSIIHTLHNVREANQYRTGPITISLCDDCTRSLAKRKVKNL